MIKVGYCVAYDWEMLRYSIPQVYDQADVICLSIDRNRQSWAGAPFTWNEEGFQQMVAEIDPLKKIRIYEDNFYNPQLMPMQNEVVQRNKIAHFLGKDGWHIQLDADEYFLDFNGFVDYLKKITSKRKVNICCPMINLYKQSSKGMLWIKPTVFKEIEFFAIATRYPSYEYGRRNGNFDVLTDFPILHQSWARAENEIWEKLNNWGHAKDFDIANYFQIWLNADEKNYSSYKNFHHLRPEAWPSLEIQPNIKDITDALDLKKSDFPLPITNWDLIKANSLWLSRFKKAWKLVSGN